MEKGERHFGIDLMRIVLMLMIVMYHIRGHGLLLISENLSETNRTLCFALQSIDQVAVSGFALISGYVGFTGRQRYSSLALLWLRVLFYSVGVTGIVYLISPASVSYASILRAFFPLLNGQYWYFTAYAGCFMLAPLARAAIAQLPRAQARLSLMGILLTYSVLPYILRNDPFTTASGNHALWFLILFAVGAYVRKYDVFAKRSVKACLLMCAGSASLQVLGGYAIQALSLRLTGKVTTLWYLICNDSPTTFLLALSVLALFSKLNPVSCKRLIRPLAASSFSVYLIHDHPLVRQMVIPQIGTSLAALPSPLVIPSVFLCAVLIDLFCTAVDCLRETLFRALRVYPLLRRAETALMRRCGIEDA